MRCINKNYSLQLEMYMASLFLPQATKRYMLPLAETSALESLLWLGLIILCHLCTYNIKEFIKVKNNLHHVMFKGKSCHLDLFLLSTAN